MREGAPNSGHYLIESMIARMESNWSRCSEVWDDKGEVWDDRYGLSSTAAGTGGSSESSWKSLHEVPDWRPSLVTRWKTSVLSVWRHSLTESVCSKQVDPFAATLESLKLDEMLDDDFKSLAGTSVASVETEEAIKMSRAQKRTRNRAHRRNRHRERQETERAPSQRAPQTTEAEASKPEMKSRKSVLVKRQKSTVSSASRKSVRFVDDDTA